MRVYGGVGRARRDGRWIVPWRLEVRAASGKVVLDFTEAVIAHPAVQIDVDAPTGAWSS